MSADCIIVTSDEKAHVQVNHHDLPELRVAGESPRKAAENLALELESQIDSTTDILHREPLEKALADVREYIDQSQ